MFKNRKGWLLAVTALTIVLGGCASGTSRLQVSLNESFELSIGQSAEVLSEGLRIILEDVAEDSRCPRGATCVWEGQAVSLVKFSYRGEQERLLLTEPGLSDRRSKASFKQYSVDFLLTPYPEVEKEIDRKDYRLQLKIQK